MHHFKSSNFFDSSSQAKALISKPEFLELLNQYTGSGRSKAAWVWLVGNNMGVIIYTFNLNISPNVSYSVLECDIVMSPNYILMIL